MEILTDFHKKQGKTIIVVTHDPHIADYSEQIVNIKDGEISIIRLKDDMALNNKLKETAEASGRPIVDLLKSNEIRVFKYGTAGIEDVTGRITIVETIHVS